jgi:hypothetical protein
MTQTANILSALAAHPDAQVKIRVGTEHWGDGRVTLAIGGSGRIRVSRERSGHCDVVEAEVSRERIDAMGRALRDAGFASLTPRPGLRVPGDVPVVLELDASEEGRYVANLWHGDRYVDPGLDRILRLHTSLVAQITRDARSA